MESSQESKPSRRVTPSRLLDPEQYSIDDVYAQFETYRRQRQEEQQEQSLRLKKKFTLSADLRELTSNMENLRLGMQWLHDQQQLQQQKRDLLTQMDVNAIDVAPAEESLQSASSQDRGDAAEPTDLVISCGTSKCLFDGCGRKIDSQVLLLHYLCDHKHQMSSSSLSCLTLVEGERVVFSFQPQFCTFRVNQILGLLAYGGPLEEQFAPRGRKRHVYNSFLPDKHSHLKAHVPVVVLICRTAVHAALMDKKLARKAQLQERDNKRDQIYVIWVVTPCDRIQLNATLFLCGRDAAVRACTVVGVRKVNHSQDTARFMAVDANYWRLTFGEMEKLSNGFRDELNLEVGLTEPNA
ncbi:uncharacterized protein Dana_GF13295 [Drosophila ananassae]|uniref:DUF4729 domain-containing protein n=1 Tax=Drosophila ananassae TaxID=7217 RepID=B3MBL0_DROAN|nr:uncharacterized protein LOC6496137 [Drosophila ananassae]EDV37141.1 uncharacterized protein Dana_GF13295 [Drosophila ananassae]